MSETRKTGHASSGEVRRWQADFDELELRMDSLRQAFTEAMRSYEMTEEIVERIHARFDDVGEQVHAMHCTYPVRRMAGTGGLPLRTPDRVGQQLPDRPGLKPTCPGASAPSCAATSA